MSKVQEAKSSQSGVANTGKAGVRYRQEALEAFYEGFKAAGIDFAVYLPDSMLDGIEQLMIERGDIEMYQCSREDEGIAMAMGGFLVGKRPVALMEGSGIGMSALILARGICSKNPDSAGCRPQQHSRRTLRLSWRDATGNGVGSAPSGSVSCSF